MPTPSIKTLFAGTDKAIFDAQIHANQILNNFLALCYECYFHHAGFDEDWTECQNASSSFFNYDVPCCEIFQDAHRDVKEMMTNNLDLSKDTRVVIRRV